MMQLEESTTLLKHRGLLKTDSEVALSSSMYKLIYSQYITCVQSMVRERRPWPRMCSAQGELGVNVFDDQATSEKTDEIFEIRPC